VEIAALDQEMSHYLPVMSISREFDVYHHIRQMTKSRNEYAQIHGPNHIVE
jgi:hypothetical protein